MHKNNPEVCITEVAIVRCTYLSQNWGIKEGVVIIRTENSVALEPRTLRRGTSCLVLIVEEVGCHETVSAGFQNSANWIQLLQWLGTTTPG